MIYQVSYELKTQEKDYSSFYSFLEDIGDGAIHVLRDTWWINYNGDKTVDELCDLIHNKLGEKDTFVITELSQNNTNGWIVTSAWQWRNEKNQ